VSRLRVLFVGDVVGKPGRKAISQLLPDFKKESNIDFCIANGENAAGGFGITSDVVEELLANGIDVLTSGNHIWDKKEIVKRIDGLPRLLRPSNYPDGVPGRGAITIRAADGVEIAVLNVAGRVFMPNLDCPFRVSEREIKKLRKSTPVVFVDIHAEATAEKIALGWFLDGLATAVIGTHTHVQTADERILPGGTAYISDAGMTGSFDSVIGVKKEHVLQRFLTQMPIRFEVAGGDLRISGVIVEADTESGKANRIERFQIVLEG
jgi:metallophosphoesterase (TIGR00282 family)